MIPLRIPLHGIHLEVSIWVDQFWNSRAKKKMYLCDRWKPKNAKPPTLDKGSSYGEVVVQPTHVDPTQTSEKTLSQNTRSRPTKSEEGAWTYLQGLLNRRKNDQLISWGKLRTVEVAWRRYKNVPTIGIKKQRTTTKVNVILLFEYWIEISDRLSTGGPR